MKRYRVLSFSFDTRANILKQEIQDAWDEHVKEQWYRNKENIEAGLANEYGAYDIQRKIENFVEMGWLPISVIAFHNKFLPQIRDAYVIGAYYAALTAACALGERILNHLILQLRDDFRGTDEYKRVFRKESFDDWSFAISILERWSVLLPQVASDFKDLKDIRNKAIHFNPETDHSDKQIAALAINKLIKIVDGQFSAFGVQPWFIPGVRGAAFIKKGFEEDPFVKRVILPSCVRVGARHEIKMEGGVFVVQDENLYEEGEISDEEFVALLNY